jgi:hypothetical protein
VIPKLETTNLCDSELLTKWDNFPKPTNFCGVASAHYRATYLRWWKEILSNANLHLPFATLGCSPLAEVGFSWKSNSFPISKPTQEGDPITPKTLSNY